MEVPDPTAHQDLIAPFKNKENYKMGLLFNTTIQNWQNKKQTTDRKIQIANICKESLTKEVQ